MQPQFAQLSPTEQEVFTLYKTNSPFASEECFADYVNQSLRDGSILPIEWQEKTFILDTIIDRASIDVAARFFRATVDLFVNPYISGNELIYPAYMSTTSEEHKVQRHYSSYFRDIAALLCINCPTGAIALDMETNTISSGDEREFLLPINSKFNVLDIQEITDREEMNRRMSAFYAEDYSSLKVYELQYIERE